MLDLFDDAALLWVGGKLEVMQYPLFDRMTARMGDKGLGPQEFHPSIQSNTLDECLDLEIVNYEGIVS